MKRILFVLATLLMVSFVFAAQGQQQGIHEPGTGLNTENSGGENQIVTQTQAQIRAGNYTTGEGNRFQIQEKEKNKLQLKSGNASAQTSMQMNQIQTQEGTKLQVKLSNGKNAEVKIMPDTASERALERLRLKVCSTENNCSIELKEVGQGNQTRAAYEVQAQKQVKVFGLFKAKMRVQTQIDAENGEIIQTKKPWWAFLSNDFEE